MAITVSSRYLEHEGGTKFYETVLLSDGSNAVLIKRWGALGGKKGGGQRSIQVGTAFEMGAAKRKIERQKTGKGYDDARSLLGYGLHNFSGRDEQSREVIIRAANAHYDAAGDIVKVIEELDGAIAAGAPTKPAAAAAPEPEIDRGPAWGSF